MVTGDLFLYIDFHTQVDSEDRVDSPGIFRAQSFDVAVFDIRRVPPEQIAVSMGCGIVHIMVGVVLSRKYNPLLCFKLSCYPQDSIDKLSESVAGCA